MEKRGLDSEMVPHRLASKDGSIVPDAKNEDGPVADEAPKAEEVDALSWNANPNCFDFEYLSLTLN